MPPIRVIHIVNSLQPGGMENGVVNIARALTPEGFEFHVCCLERSGAFAARMPQPENVRVLGKDGGFSPRAVFRLAREISRVRPHILHSHNLGPLIYTSLASCFGMTCPVLQGEHAELTDAEQSPRRLFQRRLFYRCCRKVHTVSQGLTRQLTGLGFSAAKIETIVNGVDTSRYVPGDLTLAREKIGLPAKALVIGIVGRFGPFKGHARLIDAFENLAPKFLDAHLLVVGGGGPEEAGIRERVSRSAAASRIHLAGFQADTCPYYQAMDLLVAPSVNEGLSNAVLEAMACGVPVLANTACGSSEVIEDGLDGVMADLRTAEALESWLGRALHDPHALAKMGESARRKTVSLFSIEKMVSGYAELYRKLAGWQAGTSGCG